MKKKICFILDEFLYGGIERILLNYVTLIDKSQYDVDIIILSRYEDMVQKIPKECHIEIMNLPRSHCPMYRAGAMLSRPAGAIPYYGTYLLKKIFLEPINYYKFRRISKKNYDVVIAFSGHINDMYAALKFIHGKKKMVWAHGVIYQYLLMSPAFEKMYSRFDKIVCINNIDQSDLFYCKPYLKYQIENLYNPILLNDDNATENEIREIKEKYGPFILSVARMGAPKDFETLIKAFELLTRDPQFVHNLVIVGDGPDRPKIEELISNKKLENRVFLLGSQDNVGKFYRTADLFAFSSLTEGLPTVIIEAMKYGLPVVSSKSLYGALDIIQSDEYGILTPVKDSEAMANAIKRLLNNKTDYQHFHEMSLKRYQDFTPERIICKFYQLLA